jgi:hypothetical protein
VIISGRRTRLAAIVEKEEVLLGMTELVNAKLACCSKDRSLGGGRFIEQGITSSMQF